MARLDAQGKALRQHSQSLILQTRPIPDQILGELKARLPEYFKENFGVLILQPDYQQAWKQAELVFRDSIAQLWCLPALARLLALARQQHSCAS